MPYSMRWRAQFPKGTMIDGVHVGGRFSGGWTEMVHEIEIGYLLYGQRVTEETAKEDVAILAEATRIGSPRGSGGTAAAWQAIPEAGGWAVVNRHRAANQFLVASGLITGTGAKGIRTPGYTGTFARAWHGMDPRTALRDAWIRVSTGAFKMLPFEQEMKHTSGKYARSTDDYG